MSRRDESDRITMNAAALVPLLPIERRRLATVLAESLEQLSAVLAVAPVQAQPARESSWTLEGGLEVTIAYAPEFRFDSAPNDSADRARVLDALSALAARHGFDPPVVAIATAEDLLIVAGDANGAAFEFSAALRSSFILKTGPCRVEPEPTDE